MRALQRHISPGWLMVAPFLLVVVLLYLGPLLNILWLSLTDPEPGLGNYAALFTNDALTRILWTTFRICVITTLFSVTLGYTVAYAMVHAYQKQQHVMLTLLLVSFWISVLVRTFAWLMLLGRTGLVNQSLDAIGLISQPVAFMRNELGVLIGMVHYMVPYAVLPLLANMQTLDPRVMNGLAQPRRQRGADLLAHLPASDPAGHRRLDAAGVHPSPRLLRHPGDPGRRQGADGGRVHLGPAAGDAEMGHRGDAGGH